MKAPILSFLEPEGQGRDIVMEAPHLLLVKNILFRKSTEIQNSFISGFQNHLQTRSNLHEKYTVVV